MKIRIKFQKQGVMKFVGHLDIMRYFQKAMRRAAVDIKYSEGFSPHQIMSFAAPLGVGLTSNGEYLDIEVNTTENSLCMLERLNAVMAEDMIVSSYRRLDDRAKNAMSLVAAADYSVCLRHPASPAQVDEWLDRIVAFCQSPAITLVKKTKRGEKEMDIRPYIYECERRQTQLFLKIAAGSVNNIKPELILEAFCMAEQKSYCATDYEIQREEVYADQGTEHKPQFITLEDLGEEIE